MAILRTADAWFTFKGINSDAMNVHMLEQPTRPASCEGGKYEDVPGVSGGLWVPDESYPRITVSVKLEAGDGADIDAINAWLIGEGDLVFGDEPNRAYRARITKGTDRSHSRRRLNRSWKQAFDCEPMRYLFPDAEVIDITSSVYRITNPGTTGALPLIRVSGSGDGTLMIGRSTMLLNDLSKPVYIDCEAKMAFTGDGTAESPRVLATQHVDGEWIEIAPGESYVQFTGGITGVRIAPRWRFL